MQGKNQGSSSYQFLVAINGEWQALRCGQTQQKVEEVEGFILRLRQVISTCENCTEKAESLRKGYEEVIEKMHKERKQIKKDRIAAVAFSMLNLMFAILYIAFVIYRQYQ